MLNNSTNADDPTGHYCVGDMEGCGDDGGGSGLAPANPPSGSGGGGNCPVNNPNCLLNPDRDEEYQTDTDLDGFPDIPDPYAPPIILGSHPDPNCTVEEIVECFYSRGRLPTGDYELTQDQIDEIMLAVYLDISNRPLSPSDWLDREIYDTPFWDGYDADTGSICVNSKCYNRTEVNYFAQGMYSAKYEGATIGQIIAHAWKYKEYGHGASEGVIFWLKEGYEFFQDQQKCFACYGYLK